MDLKVISALSIKEVVELVIELFVIIDYNGDADSSCSKQCVVYKKLVIFFLSLVMQAPTGYPF